MSDTTTLEILEQARDLIRDEKNWCQGKAYTDTHLTGGCALGAIALVNTYQRGCVPHGAAAALAIQAQPQTVSGFNDTHTHAEVLELFSLAIAAELAKTQVDKPKVGSSTDEPTTVGEPVLSGAC